MITRTRLAAIAATAALTLGLAACGGDDDADDPIKEAAQRCQDEVAEYAKYPTTADWLDGPSMAQYGESDDNIIVIRGTATFNNDGGQPVNSIYGCDLNVSTDDWDEHPYLMPDRDAEARLIGPRWEGSTSPMKESFGDDMMNEYTNGFGRNWKS